MNLDQLLTDAARQVADQVDPPEVDLEAGRVVVADRPGLVSPFPDDVPPAAPAAPPTPVEGDA